MIVSGMEAHIYVFPLLLLLKSPRSIKLVHVLPKAEILALLTKGISVFELLLIIIFIFLSGIVSNLFFDSPLIPYLK